MSSGPTLDIARRRLLSQRIVGEPCDSPTGVVEWLVAAQSQDYASAKWAVGIRLRGATDALVEDALTRGAILRTHVLRPTWHFVSPTDIRWLLALTGPRVQAANAHMCRKVGLDSRTLRRCHSALAKALEGGHSLTRDELRVVLGRSRIPTEGEQRMAYIMMSAELDALVCSGPRRGKQFTYALLDERVTSTKPMERDEALAELARRYFVSRGPATVHDFAKWSGLTVADARAGLESVRTTLSSEELGGKTLWSGSTGLAVPRPKSPSVHLLSIYDEYVSGYKDRSAIVSAEHGARLIGMGNALTHIVVVGGQIVGTWKRRLEGKAVVVTTELLARPTKGAERAAKAAIRRYGEFVELPVKVE